MAGIAKLKKVQLGLESSEGTEANATALWLGDVDMQDNREAEFPDENIGYFGDVDRSYIPYADSTWDFKEHPANFEQICYPFAAGIDDTVSGSANGGTSNAYTYAYTMATTAVPTTKTYTLEGGDNEQEYQSLGCFCEEITLKGAPKKALTIAHKWRGKSLAKGTYTSNVAIPTVEQILFGNGKIYCDAVGGTLGSTQLTNTWLGFDMKIKTGLEAVATADGGTSYSYKIIGVPQVTGNLTFVHDSAGIARYDDFAAGTTKKVRMLFTGSSTGFTGTGGTFTTRALQLDFSMKINKVKLLDKVGPLNTVKVDFKAVYNGTASLFFVATVCNLLSALA